MCVCGINMCELLFATAVIHCMMPGSKIPLEGSLAKVLCEIPAAVQ